MKVFSFDDLDCGRAPRLDSFRVVVDHARGRFADCPGVYGGIVLGSTICREPRRTSDVDILVVARNNQVVPACNIVCRGIKEYATSLYVPVSCMVMPLEDLESGDHTIGAAFQLHLQNAVKRGGGFGENVLSRVSLERQLPIVEQVRQTILKKREHIMNWSTCPRASISPEQRVQFCGYVLSIAPSICLNMLYVHDPDFEDSGGEEAYVAYQKVFRNSDARDSLNNLIMWRERYDETVLMSQTPGDERPSGSYLTEWNEKAYNDMLDFMESMIIPFAMIFLGWNLARLREM